MGTTVKQEINPSKILQIGSGFWASKTLLTAVNMELFTVLAKRELAAKEIQTRLGLHSRGLYDFLDALVALGFLERSGLLETSSYRNAPDTDMFLDKNKPSYIGGILEMCNNRLYSFWNDLEDGLKTGLPQCETKNGGKPIFEEVYGDPEKLREFIGAMAGAQMGNFMAFANGFDFSDYKTLCDIGGAGGHLSAQVALKNSHMSCISFDLPPVCPVAHENIKNMELTDRVQVLPGDFFSDDFPKADIITMGNILHDWGKNDKKTLIQKAFDALPQDGAFVVIENIIDDNRSENTFGLLMSLNMLIETAEGYDFTASEFKELVEQAGFRRTALVPLTGPASAAIAFK